MDPKCQKYKSNYMYTIMKLLQTSGKWGILKALEQGGKEHVMYRETNVMMTANFSSETMHANSTSTSESLKPANLE